MTRQRSKPARKPARSCSRRWTTASNPPSHWRTPAPASLPSPTTTSTLSRAATSPARTPPLKTPRRFAHQVSILYND